MWQKVDASIFGEMKPVETYLFYDGPRAFSIQHNDRWFYIHQCDECLEHWSYWAREVTPVDLQLLESNQITLKNFILSGKPLYLIQEYGNNKPIEAFIVDPENFPPDHFPNDGVYLTRCEKQGEDSI